jgi:hypothetical protein
VAGGLAAAGLKFVDGAFDEPSLGVGQQGPEGEAEAAGAIGSGGQDGSSLYATYPEPIKMSRIGSLKI